MQNIAKAGIGYASPFPQPAALFTLQIIEDALHPQQLYKSFYAVTDQSFGFASIKNQTS